MVRDAVTRVQSASVVVADVEMADSLENEQALFGTDHMIVGRFLTLGEEPADGHVEGFGDLEQREKAGLPRSRSI